MNFDVLFENIHLAGPGLENYRKTLQAFRDVTQEVVEEISLVEPVAEVDTSLGVNKNILGLNEQYPGVCNFIVGRVVERVKGARRRPVYETLTQPDVVEKTA